jgi:hypothetical protein
LQDFKILLFDYFDKNEKKLSINQFPI